MGEDSQNPLVRQMHGRVLYLMIAVIALNLLYPLGEFGSRGAIIFTTLYCGSLGLGAFVIAINRTRLVIAIVFSIILAIVSVFWYTDPLNPLIAIPAYIMYALFNITIILNLIGYIADVEEVTRSVVYAAATIYFMFANAFVPLFVLIDILTQMFTGASAFAMAASPDTPVTWVEMSHYSFTTLTTLGYGDIIPVSSWARALSNFEAMLGVLYTSILVARLVSLYVEASPTERGRL